MNTMGRRRARASLVIVLLVVVPFVMSTIHPAAAQERPLRVIFMHHSTGAGLIWGGALREHVTALGYDFWDHGYNEEGLTDGAGNPLRTNWNVPDDNTDPDGWYAIFNQPVTDPPANTFSHMLDYDVILFKSCFPSSNIEDDGMFADYQRYFLSMRDIMDQHPDRLFIPFTTPPLVPNETTAENAARARRWAAYLTSDEYLAGHPNIAVFDFFSALADEDGFLRADYRADEWDSHPNDIANQAVAPLLAAFVDEAVRAYWPDAMPEASVPAPDTGGDPNEVPPFMDEPHDVVANFEAADVLAEWWDYSNADVPLFHCVRATPGYEGSLGALQITYQTAADASAGCGVNFDANPAWKNAAGIQFMWRADTPGLYLRVGLAVADPTQSSPDSEEATPFELELQTVASNTGDDWALVSIYWEDLVKAPWVEGGVDTFDAGQVVWMAFDVGYWEASQTGTIWIDDVRLIIGG